MTIINPIYAADYFNLNYGWKFTKGNPENAPSPGFNDSSWEPITLPHDWAIKGPFDPNGSGNTGKLPWKGEGWYRKIFTLDKKYDGKTVYILFDGVMAQPQVFVNGKPAGKWDYGYNSFYLDITSLVKYEGQNLIAVYADTRQHDSRWYPGAGIYRKVQLFIADQVHVPIWETQVLTPEVTDAYANVRIISSVNNLSDAAKTLKVTHAIINAEGISLTEKSTEKTVQAGKVQDFETWLTVIRPVRWDIDHPVLYNVRTTITSNDKVVDTSIATFGFRTFRFTADDGFHLNGRRVQMKGVNLHHDQGPLGAAFNTRAMERQLEIMREMGCNAIRTSHNVCAPELLDLCDKMGFLVFNEAFDKWDRKADILPETDFYEFGERNLKNFIMRDRNHPSVVIWSVGNEMGDVQANLNGGLQKLQAMVGIVRKYDPSRPVTMACDQPGNAKWRHFDFYDLHSWNYGQRYIPARNADPSKPVIISESASTVSTRGFYELPLPEKKTSFTASLQVSSYDLNAPMWAEIGDDDFMWQENDRYICGEFVWTGFDYLGEPTPYGDEYARFGNMPREKTSRSSYFGIVDLGGIPKDRYYLYRSHWAPEKTTVHILPHWNWDGFEGKNVPVFVYTNGDGAELFLNGKSMGKKFKNPKSEVSTDRYRLMWKDVIYEPGELKAVVYREGKIMGEQVMKTAGKPDILKLTPDRTVLAASGEDLSYIQAECFDKNGNFCPLAEHLIKFEIKGPGEIAGVCNGNPQSYDVMTGNTMNLFFGKVIVIIRSKQNQPGEIVVTASADGLKKTETKIVCK